MQQKELRLALVCYGGVSLAVYMHGVTKEIWHLARASRAFHADATERLGSGEEGVAGAYRALLAEIEADAGLRLRVLPDVLTGASAGGINAVFLAQAVQTGQSLEPLTELWLKNADVSELTDPDAQPMWRYAKLWAQPIAEWVSQRSGTAVSETVSPETREEVRRKVSRLVRGRWFSPPFSGEVFSAMLLEALQTMADGEQGEPLLPQAHPLDLSVTATDFRGHTELLRLNSPEVVQETEHRMPVAFRAATRSEPLADPLELVLAARATASFPGAFPPLMLSEIDRLANSEGLGWDSRAAFLERIMPVHARDATTETVSLIDGSVLVNAPFGAALEAIATRHSQREVDRRIVYIDPRADRTGAFAENADEPVGFFGAILGSLSTIPREQPIRDDLERIEQLSHDARRMRRIVMSMHPDIDRAVEKLFGYTIFLDRPTPRRLANWRAKAHDAAAQRSGFAFNAYAQTKFASIIGRLAKITHSAAPQSGLADRSLIADRLRDHLAATGLEPLVEENGRASEAAIRFFRAHDIGFRIRRLQLLARRCSREWEVDPAIPDDALDLARAHIQAILGIYQRADAAARDAQDFPAIAMRVMERPGDVLDHLARTRLLPETDAEAEIMLAAALEAMPRELRRRMLLTYVGFAFYDVATLPLFQREGFNEYNPVKIDRISPEDARSIREGGARATLRGIEFYNFGAFFSRAYRENDYLWGRLHGAERMIDLVTSTLARPLEEARVRSAKRRVFLAILDEEAAAGRCAGDLIATIRGEVIARLG